MSARRGATLTDSLGAVALYLLCAARRAGAAGATVDVRSVAELVQAFADLPTLAEPVTIRVSPGVYELGATLRASGVKNVSIGAHPPPVNLTAQPGVRLLSIAGADAWRVRGLTFTGVSIGGDPPPGALPGGCAQIVDSSVLFESCAFVGNDNQGDFGGALSVEGASAVRLVNASFVGNHLESPTYEPPPAFLRGGAAINVAGSSVLECVGCEFRANSGNWFVSGGGIALRDSTLGVLDGCAFEANMVDGAGAGVLVTDRARATISGCAFAANVANGAGGALQLFQDASVNVTDTAFDANEGHQGGGAIALWDRAALALSRCGFTANVAQAQGTSVGGAVMLGSAYGDTVSADIERCSFERNVADWGGAMAAIVGRRWEVYGNTFAGNRASQCAAIFSNADIPGVCKGTGELIRAPDACNDTEASAVCASPPFPPPSPPPGHGTHRPTCPMCVRHRCTLYGGNKCASRRGYTDPQGAQRALCACACCGEQCTLGPHCAVEAAELRGGAPRRATPSAASGRPPARPPPAAVDAAAAAVAVGVVALALAAAAAVRRGGGQHVPGVARAARRAARIRGGEGGGDGAGGLF